MREPGTTLQGEPKLTETRHTLSKLYNKMVLTQVFRVDLLGQPSTPKFQIVSLRGRLGSPRRCHTSRA